MCKLRRDNRRGNSAGGAPPQHCREAEGSRLDDPESRLPTPVCGHGGMLSESRLCNACRCGENMHESCRSLYELVVSQRGRVCHVANSSPRSFPWHSFRACVKKDLLPERSDEDRFTPAYKLIGDLIASEKIDGRMRLASARVNLLEACASKGSSSSRH